MIKAVVNKSERLGGKGNICVQASTIEEAHSQLSREAALEHAKQLGMGRPGISGTPWIEWVDDKGITIPVDQFQTTTNKSVHIMWPIQEGL
jgi:hypothetical protein